MDDEIEKLRRIVAQGGDAVDVARLLTRLCRAGDSPSLDVTRTLTREAYRADVHRLVAEVRALGAAGEIAGTGDVGNHCESAFPGWYRTLLEGTGRLSDAAVMRETVAQAGIDLDDLMHRDNEFCECDAHQKVRCLAFRAISRDVSRELDRLAGNGTGIMAGVPPMLSRVTSQTLGDGTLIDVLGGTKVRLDKPHVVGSRLVYEWNMIVFTPKEWREIQ